MHIALMHCSFSFPCPIVRDLVSPEMVADLGFEFLIPFLFFAFAFSFFFFGFASCIATCFEYDTHPLHTEV